MKIKQNMAIINIAGMVVLLVIVFYITNAYEYSLETHKVKDGIKIETLSLGGHYSSVKTLEIYEALKNTKVVSFVAKNQKSRMHTITVKRGKNEFNDKYLDGYQINYPAGEVHNFKSGITYKVVVKWKSLSKETEFVIQNNS